MSKTYIGAYNVVNPNLAYNQSNGTVANPMTSDLDAGSNKIINLANPADSGDAVNLGYLESVVPDASKFIDNPLTSTLNANNNVISNVVALTMKDTVQDLTTYTMTLVNGALVSENASDPSSVQLHITINETLGKPYYTDFRSHPISNVSLIGFNDGGVISKSDSSFQLNQPLDMNNNYIKDVQNIQFYNAPPLEIDLSNNLVYDDSIIVTASNINGYIAQANWEPTASSDLTMSSHNINFTSGNIVMQSGSILLNNSVSLNVNNNNDLTVGNNTVIACSDKILGSVPMVDSTPNSAIAIDRMNPIMWASDTIIKSGIFDNPVFDVEITMTPQAGTMAVDTSTCSIELGIGSIQNPLNGGTYAVFATYTGGFTQHENGDITCKFRTDEISPYLTTSTWSDCCSTVATTNFYVSIMACAVAITNPDYNIINIQSSSATINVVSTNDQFKDNELINVNNNVSIQSYNVSSVGQLETGVTTINIFDYANNTSLVNLGSLYVSCMVVSTSLCLKISAFIFDNQIVPSSGTQQIIYKDASFVSCVLGLNDFQLSIQLTMNSNLVGIAPCKCKTKIMCPI